MGKRKKVRLIFVLVLIAFFIVFGAGYTFAHGDGGGGGGGGIDSDSNNTSQSTSQSTGFIIRSIQDSELADYEEAGLFDQYNQGHDRMENEFRPITRDSDQQLDDNQDALDRAEFFAWLAEMAEGSGDTLWGGIPGTSNLNERAPGDKSGDTTPIDVNTSAEPPGLSDWALFFAWNGSLNISRTLGYGMLGGNNKRTYNLNQQSRSGQAINNFIANLNYRANHNNSSSYNIVGEHHEAPRAE